MHGKTFIALAALGALIAFPASDALARGGGGHGGGGGFRGGGFGGAGFHGGGGFRGGGFGGAGMRGAGFGGGFRGAGLRAGGFRGMAFQGGGFRGARFQGAGVRNMGFYGPGWRAGRVAFGPNRVFGPRVAFAGHRGFRHRRFVGPVFVSSFGLFGYPGFYDGYYDGFGYGSCYQWQQVPTRVGWRWRRAWVCGAGDYFF